MSANFCACIDTVDAKRTINNNNFFIVLILLYGSLFTFYFSLLTSHFSLLTSHFSLPLEFLSEDEVEVAAALSPDVGTLKDLVEAVGPVNTHESDHRQEDANADAS